MHVLIMYLQYKQYVYICAYVVRVATFTGSWYRQPVNKVPTVIILYSVV
jgi:hypothetical protein